MFYLSSTCSSRTDPQQVIAELADLGVRHIELSGNLDYQPDLRTLIQGEMKKRDLRFLLHHYAPAPEKPFVMNIASFDDDIWSRSKDVLSDSRDLADAIQSPFCAVHGGHDIDMKPEMQNLHFIVDQASRREKPEARAKFYQNLKEVMDTIFSSQGRLVVENLAVKGEGENYSLLSSPDEILEFVEFSKTYPNLGLLLDLGHLSVAGYHMGFDAPQTARQLLAEHEDKVFGIHCSENDGTFDYHQIHKSDSWQLALIDDFLDELSDKPIVFEWSRKTNSVEDLGTGIKMLNERYESALCR